MTSFREHRQWHVNWQLTEGGWRNNGQYDTLCARFVQYSPLYTRYKLHCLGREIGFLHRSINNRIQKENTTTRRLSASCSLTSAPVQLHGIEILAPTSYKPIFSFISKFLYFLLLLSIHSLLPSIPSTPYFYY